MADAMTLRSWIQENLKWHRRFCLVADYWPLWIHPEKVVGRRSLDEEVIPLPSGAGDAETVDGLRTVCAILAQGWEAIAFARSPSGFYALLCPMDAGGAEAEAREPHRLAVIDGKSLAGVLRTMQDAVDTLEPYTALWALDG